MSRRETRIPSLDNGRGIIPRGVVIGTLGAGLLLAGSSFLGSMRRWFGPMPSF
jgi:hypothetical protein